MFRYKTVSNGGDFVVLVLDARSDLRPKEEWQCVNAARCWRFGAVCCYSWLAACCGWAIVLYKECSSEY